LHSYVDYLDYSGIRSSQQDHIYRNTNSDTTEEHMEFTTSEKKEWERGVSEQSP
jgi:hypothetical protein